MSFYNHYANRSRNKFGEKVKKNFARKLFDMVEQRLKNNKRILEIGPGDGYIADLAIHKGYDYIGLEGSQGVYEKLKQQNYNVIKTFVPPLPSSIGKFDVCYLLHMIEHLNSIKDASELISQIYKCLNINGRIVIATPDYLKWDKDFFNCDYTHNLPFTVKRLSQLLLNEKFEIEYVGYYVGDQFGPLRFLIYWFGKLFYFRWLDNYLKNSLKSDVWYRAYLTCLPNIVLIAKKIP